jgi:adenosine kinase
VSIIVTGSLAFDHIMDFPGFFKDHILPDKVHVLNVSFLVTSLKRQRGGTAGNIAYNAALLGLRPRVIAAAGNDFDEYRAALDARGVDTSAILVAPDDLTASCFITTDRADNQITGFYSGAMRHAAENSLRDLAGPDAELAIVAADNPDAMRRYPRECRALDLPYIYDPGQGLPMLSAEDLLDGLTGARVLIGNDYELALIAEKTGLDRAALRERVALLVVTLGEGGAELDAQGEVVKVPAAPAREVLDPTGAGDAFRAGLILGLTRGFPLDLTGRIAAQAATYAVEHRGTQAHAYTPAEFAARFNRSFPDAPPLTPRLVPQGVAVA